MKNMFACFALLSITAIVSLGCSKPPSGDSGAVMSEALYKSATLCGHCGQIKGSDSCCAEGAATCAKCELQKGSAGCCKMKAGDDVVLCAHCGQIKGDDACCAEGAEACAKCGLHKGAPGCCKLEKLAGDGESALEGDKDEVSEEKSEPVASANKNMKTLLADCGECEDDDDHDHGDDDDDEAARLV